MNCLVLIDSGGIPAMTGTELGTGRGKRCSLDDDRKYTVTDEVLPIRNFSKEWIAGGQFAMCSEVHGQWLVTGVPC